MPRTWEEVGAPCERLIEAGVETPMSFGWNVTGNWFLQALMWKQGRPPMAGTDFMLDTSEGLRALETMDALFERCEMPNLATEDGQALFTSGNAAMLFRSTSAVGSVERAKGTSPSSTSSPAATRRCWSRRRKTRPSSGRAGRG